MANVTGPTSSTDDAITRWDGTSGTLVKDSTVLLDDPGNLTGINSISSDGGAFTSDGSGNVSAASFNGVFNGSSTTQSPADNSTLLATTAYADAAAAAVPVVTDLDDLSDCITQYAIKSIFIGSGSGPGTGGASFNTALGQNCLSAVTGASNTAIGFEALQHNTSGNLNLAIGREALTLNTTGSSNLAIGDNAGNIISTGSGNTIIGAAAGQTLTTGSENIIIGHGADVASASTSNTLNIGNVIKATGMNVPSTSTATVAGALTVTGLITGTSTTQSPGDNSTKLATTAYVDAAVAAGGPHATTFQWLTSGSGATYTTPANCKGLLIRMTGGGGAGGSDAAGTPQSGGNGGDTIFNSIHAKGGVGGSAGSASAGGAGGRGTTAGTGTASFRVLGSAGTGAGRGGAGVSFAGGNGGSSAFGGAGDSAQGDANGNAAFANSGSGGGGAGSGSNSGGGGGQAGEYVEIYISSPSATYTYTIGAAGAATTTGTFNGAAGGTGIIIVTEYY
jgi:hypothetical protein